MKLDQAVKVYQEYHKMNSGKNTIEPYGITLSKLCDHFGKDRELAAITSDEILSFLSKITEGGKQQTEHGRYSNLKAFFNFINTNLDPTPLTLGVARNTEIMQRFCCTQHLFFARLSASTLPVQT